jgi:hypothetical protein
VTSPTRRSGEREPADSIGDQWNVIGGWLLSLTLAIPYAIWVSVRGRASVEGLCLFATVLALVFVALLSTVALACMVSWIPLYD